MHRQSDPLRIGWLGILIVALALVGLSCRPRPESLRQKAIQAEAEARAGFEQRDVGAADLAAARAEEVLDQMKHLAERGELRGAAGEAWLKEVREAAGAARNYAELAREELFCRKHLDQLKLKAYRHARETLCGYALAGLAPAAERFARAGTNGLSPAEQSLADLAWRVGEWLEDEPPLREGKPDWATAAAHLRTATNGAPPRLGLLLGLAFAAGGFSDFALYEIEAVDAAKLTSTNARTLYHLERGALYAVQGWDRTATRELSLAAPGAAGNWPGPVSTQIVAVLHFWLADRALQTRTFRLADQETARATALWPDCPLAPFVAADQLVATDHWEKAAELLESAAAKGGNPWWVNRLSQRAQELRASRGACPLLCADLNFLVDALRQTAGDSVGSWPGWSKVGDWLTLGRALGKQLLESLPGAAGR